MADGSAIALVTWLVAAMQSWVPAGPEHHAFREGLARDLVAVAFDPREPPVVHSAHPRADTALVLARIAALEGGLREDVDAGHCRANECDHGTAFTLFQIRPGAGVLLDGGGYDYAWRRPAAWRASHAAEVFDGRALVEDRGVAIRVALHMVRASLRHTGGLGEYTGEGRHGGRLAFNRWDKAIFWARLHPSPVSDNDVELSIREVTGVRDVVRSAR